VSQDEQQYADNDLLRETDDDDIVASRKRKTAAPKTPHNGLSQVGFTIVILLVILVGVALGSWLANVGRPAANPSATATDAMQPTDTPSVDPQVRIMQLQDQIAADPNDTDARLELGVLLFQDAQDLEGARAQWVAVTQIDPTNENAWYDLGFYYLSIDPPDCVGAGQAWNTVMQLDPSGDNASTIMGHMSDLMPTVCGTPSPSAAPTTGG